VRSPTPDCSRTTGIQADPGPFDTQERQTCSTLVHPGVNKLSTARAMSGDGRSVLTNRTVRKPYGIQTTGTIRHTGRSDPFRTRPPRGEQASVIGQGVFTEKQAGQEPLEFKQTLESRSRAATRSHNSTISQTDQPNPAGLPVMYLGPGRKGTGPLRSCFSRRTAFSVPSTCGYVGLRRGFGVLHEHISDTKQAVLASLAPKSSTE